MEVCCVAHLTTKARPVQALMSYIRRVPKQNCTQFSNITLVVSNALHNWHTQSVQQCITTELAKYGTLNPTYSPTRVNHANEIRRDPVKRARVLYKNSWSLITHSVGIEVLIISRQFAINPVNVTIYGMFKDYKVC